MAGRGIYNKAFRQRNPPQNPISFIHILFIQLGVRRMAGIKSETTTVVAKQMYGNKRASLTKGNPHPGRRLPQSIRSVVPKEVVSRGDAPAQGHRRWCGVSSWSWPCAWVLPLEFAHSSPSIPLDRCPPQLLTPLHSPPPPHPVSPLEPLCRSSWGWSSVPHPV